MPRSKKPRPRKHGSRTEGPTLLVRRSKAGTELAYAKFNGRIVSFGRADDPTSRIRFARFKAEWEANGRRLPQEDCDATEATVEDLCDAYLARAETHYRRRDGTPTGQLASVVSATKWLLALYRDLPCSSFDAVALDTLRQQLVDAKREPKGKGPARDTPPVPRYTRGTINKRIATIRAAFKWGASPEGRRIVPSAVVADLTTLRPLEPGRTIARESSPRFLHYG